MKKFFISLSFWDAGKEGFELYLKEFLKINKNILINQKYIKYF